MTAETLPWLRVARGYLAAGIKEIPGPGTHPVLARWLGQLGGWWSDDETAWCGTFASTCLVEAGLPKPRAWYRARAYAEYGHELDRRAYGAIVVYERGGGGHVGFIVGQDERGRILTLGGNQGDRVSIAPFDAWRVIAYRWPPDDGLYPPVQPLPFIRSSAPSSAGEA